MTADTTGHRIGGRAASSRRLIALLCLLAFLATLVGHTEIASALPISEGYSISAGDTDTSVDLDHDGSAVQQHCVHGGHCGSYAVLPMAWSGNPRDATARRSPLRQSARGRASTPWHRPPRTSDIG